MLAANSYDRQVTEAARIVARDRAVGRNVAELHNMVARVEVGDR